MKADIATLWLIRKSRGEIQGPFEFTELKKALLDGEVSIDSELCPGNGHWLTFHDLEELKLHFEDQDLHQILRVLRGVQDLQDDDTRTDLATNVEENRAEREAKKSSSHQFSIKTPLGMERIQFFTLFFLSGVALSLLVVIWILYALRQGNV